METLYDTWTGNDADFRQRTWTVEQLAKCAQNDLWAACYWEPIDATADCWQRHRSVFSMVSLLHGRFHCQSELHVFVSRAVLPHRSDSMDDRLAWKRSGGRYEDFSRYKLSVLTDMFETFVNQHGTTYTMHTPRRTENSVDRMPCRLYKVIVSVCLLLLLLLLFFDDHISWELCYYYYFL